MSKERAIHNTILDRWWNVLYPWVIKMKEKEKNRYEYWENKSECRYWLVMESCWRCLFETLCRLEKDRWNDTHEVELTS
jgi:hypothetical protein